MTYPCMKFCGLGPDDHCVVSSKVEEDALVGVWADTPAAFYEELPAGCTRAPKPAAKEAKKEAPKPVAPSACALCGDPGHDIKACPEIANLKG